MQIKHKKVKFFNFEPNKKSVRFARYSDRGVPLYLPIYSRYLENKKLINPVPSRTRCTGKSKKRLATLAITGNFLSYDRIFRFSFLWKNVFRVICCLIVYVLAFKVVSSFDFEIKTHYLFNFFSIACYHYYYYRYLKILTKKFGKFKGIF